MCVCVCESGKSDLMALHEFAIKMKTALVQRVKVKCGEDVYTYIRLIHIYGVYVYECYGL